MILEYISVFRDTADNIIHLGKTDNHAQRHKIRYNIVTIKATKIKVRFPQVTSETVATEHDAGTMANESSALPPFHHRLVSSRREAWETRGDFASHVSLAA